MRELPRGTVTFLFTDIEGSTRLLHELGADGYAAALAEHRAVLREAFERQDGVEVDTQGDAFFVAFPTAPGALEAARAAQQKLGLPVRMGLHTGTPLLTDEGYVGVDVHRAARIAAAGHGRQVLLSAATATLVDPAELRDLGEHRLKDLSAPERIFQLGSEDFPSLKTLYRTNLPIPATPFLGREQELAAVGELLARDDVRLLTLTGAGGTGKTRLALQAAGEAADAYPDGVWWVPLAPLADAADVAPAAARALGGGGLLHELVGDRKLLLLLDNFEHVVDAAAVVGDTLIRCPNAAVLVTSRERLRVQGEHLYSVPIMERAEARRLFVTRARAARSDFEPDEYVDELCERLDDLPLGLELAAARTTLLSTEQLLERLGNRLDLLRGGRDAETRQQTLRATIEWSYDLLDEDERSVLAALSVFRGGWTLEAAEQVAGADIELMQSLVDKSLVRRWESGRFAMLETIREFAAEHLAACGADAVRRRQAEFLVALAESANLWPEAMAEGRVGRHELFLPELDNVRAALEWLVAVDEIELGLGLALRLENFWVTTDPVEGRRWIGELFERRRELPPELRAWTLRALGGATYVLGDFAEGHRYMGEAQAVYEELGDSAAIAHMGTREAVEASRTGDLVRARELCERSLALDSRPFNAAQVSRILGGIAYREGQADEAIELVDRAASQAAEIGFRWWQAGSLLQAAEIALTSGRAGDDVRLRLLTALPVAHEIGDRQMSCYGLALLAWVTADAGDAQAAGVFWGAAEAEAERGSFDPLVDDRAVYEPHVSVVAGPEFENGVRTGRAMSLDDAVAYALGP